MKKKFLISVAIILFIGIAPKLVIYYQNTINSEIVTNLKGQIYYIKRVNDVRTLFKSDANLKNEKLIYGHQGEGVDSYGNSNNNIGDFYYDIKSKTINFTAMNNGDWTLFSMKEGESKPTPIKKADIVLNTNSIKNETGTITVTEKKGSLYITENGEERSIKKFYGIYNDKATGYRPIVLSSDDKYLVYYSFEHLTTLGVMVEGLITDNCGHNYIMDLSTGKSTRYIDSFDIQWIMVAD